MRVVSVAHLALLATDGKNLPELNPGSDAASAQWQPVHEVLANEKLAFDHRDILTAALDRLAGKIEYTLTAARLIPEQFTLSQLRGVYDAVWGTTMDPGNFTRKMTALLADSGRKEPRAKGAPASVFSVDKDFISPPLTRPAAAPGPGSPPEGN
jgi:8-oxo-dGTP diphosphatase